MSARVVNDKDLLLKVAAGDEQAFTRLVNLHFHSLGLLILKITRSREMAEEVVQDVFLKIWMAREVLAEIENFESYIFKVCKNQALNALRDSTREMARFKKIEHLLESDGSLINDTNKIEEQYYSLLDEAIDQLPQQQKSAFLLSRKERKKYEEIAAEMQISKETVKKYLQYATRSVSEYVRERMDPAVIALLLLSEYPIHHFV